MPAHIGDGSRFRSIRGSLICGFHDDARSRSATAVWVVSRSSPKAQVEGDKVQLLTWPYGTVAMPIVLAVFSR